MVALFISESTTLFGFSEAGYRAPVVIAIVAEVVTVLLLAPLAVIRIRRALSRWRATSEGSGNRRSRTPRSQAGGVY